MSPDASHLALKTSRVEEEVGRECLVPLARQVGLERRATAEAELLQCIYIEILSYIPLTYVYTRGGDIYTACACACACAVQQCI